MKNIQEEDPDMIFFWTDDERKWLVNHFGVCQKCNIELIQALCFQSLDKDKASSCGSK